MSGGGAAADREITCVSLMIRTHACNEFKWASAGALALSAGLTSRQKPYACSLRRQVPSVPGCKTHPTASRGKRLRGSPTSFPTPSEEGSAIFSISSALDAPGPEYCEKKLQDVSSWQAGPFYPHYYLQRKDDQE